MANNSDKKIVRKSRFDHRHFSPQEDRTEYRFLLVFVVYLPRRSKRNNVHTILRCLGCDRAKYDLKARLARTEREKKVNDLAKNLKEAKDRKDILQQDDPQQARAFFKSTYSIKFYLKGIYCIACLRS